MDIGQLKQLATRPAHAPSLVPADSLQAVAGAGLAGDRHADVLSPRQVLLASADAYRDFALSAHALGENLLVDLDTARLASGTVLLIGEDVRLRLMFQCEPCGALDVHRRGLSGRIGHRRGVLARVLTGGVLRRGDRIRDLGRLLPSWSDDWRARVAQVLVAVPDGMVVSYAQLARLAGLQSNYCRAFPRLLAKLEPALAGKAVRAQAALGRRCWDGAGLFEDGDYGACSS